MPQQPREGHAPARLIPLSLCDHPEALDHGRGETADHVTEGPHSRLIACSPREQDIRDGSAPVWMPLVGGRTSEKGLAPHAHKA
jgi:hypothetical protein